MIVNTGGRFVCLFGYRVVHSNTELDISSWIRIYRTGSYPNGHRIYLGKPHKKVLILVVRPLRPLPPLGLVALGTFFLTLKKFFSLSGRALTPPPVLVAGPLEKELFFAASLRVMPKT